MRWVKAAERLPEKHGSYYVKVYTELNTHPENDGGTIYKDADIWNGKDWAAYKDHPYDAVIEWLYEPPTTV